MPGKIIKSPLNYTGGKTKLLPQLLPLFQHNNIDTFVDLFCGGGNVGINVDSHRTIYNDVSIPVVRMLSYFEQNTYETICQRVEQIINDFELSNTLEHSYEYYGCNSASGLGKYNKPGHFRLREFVNAMNHDDERYYLYLYTLIIFSFNNQIRFNNKGEFNLPVGKRDFNKRLRSNLKAFSEKIQERNNIFSTQDFRNFDYHLLTEQDFVYCDPPYLITKATYNENGGWTEQDERDLLRTLDMLDEMHIRFALSNVLEHKGNTNHILLEWSARYDVNILNFNYNNSNYQSESKKNKTIEVLIKNY